MQAQGQAGWNAFVRESLRAWYHVLKAVIALVSQGQDDADLYPGLWSGVLGAWISQGMALGLLLGGWWMAFLFGRHSPSGPWAEWGLPLGLVALGLVTGIQGAPASEDGLPWPVAPARWAWIRWISGMGHPGLIWAFGTLTFLIAGRAARWEEWAPFLVLGPACWAMLSLHALAGPWRSRRGRRWLGQGAGHWVAFLGVAVAFLLLPTPQVVWGAVAFAALWHGQWLRPFRGAEAQTRAQLLAPMAPSRILGGRTVQLGMTYLLQSAVLIILAQAKGMILLPLIAWFPIVPTLVGSWMAPWLWSPASDLASRPLAWGTLFVSIVSATHFAAIGSMAGFLEYAMAIGLILLQTRRRLAAWPKAAEALV